MLAIIGVDGSFKWLNQMWSRILGQSEPELLSKSCFGLIHPADRAAFKHALQHLSAGGESIQVEYRFCGEQGAVKWLRLLIARARGQARFYLMGRVVTEATTFTKTNPAPEKKNHLLAYYDVLTNLPNRVLFTDRLTQAVTSAQRNKQVVAVMLIDLSRFKSITDTLGLAAGDRLLQDVTERLNSHVQASDTVAYLGGSEFAILLPQVANTERVIERAQEILETFKPAFLIADHELYLASSIGISLCPDDGQEAEALMVNASAALDRAKEQGGSNYQFYTANMNAKALKLLALENSLRRGIERGEFVLYYQPQIKTTTGQIVGAEALVRWQHPDWGMISPAEFIPVAEASGLIVPLGEWVLRTACLQNMAWQAAGLPPLRVSVNLSAHQFQKSRVVESVAQVLAETGLAPAFLDLELTESSVMKNAEDAIATLRALKEMGVFISIDDFGTGYSSLSYLKRFPLDVLKVDQSFVRETTTDANDAAIVRAIITLAHSLNLKVIAEGVETEAQLNFLRDLNCDELQGYLISRPIPAADFQQLLEQSQPHHWTSMIFDYLSAAAD